MQLKDVEALEGRAAAWADTYQPSIADATAAQERTKLREEFTRNGVQLVDEARLDEHEAEWRRRWDRQAFTDGAALETDRDLALARTDEAIADRERLRTPQETHGFTSEKYLLASILDEMQMTSARQRLAGLERLELVDVYQAAKDDANNALVRLIEEAVTSGTLARLGLRDNPTTDALALPRLTAACAARRQARVPAELLTARDRLRKLKTTNFDFTMRHLRAGRGIAVRPAVTAVKVLA